MAASSASESAPFHLADELLPQFGSPCEAVCALDNGSILTGDDSGSASLHERTPDGRFRCALEMVHAGRAVRSVAGLPGGGFACGSLDGCIRIHAVDGSLQKTLVGHKGGVISLSVSESGQLVSGSWDGTFRVWDLETGKEAARSKELENAISVACLSSGTIVSCSTGRKEHDRHVDYHVRLHSADGSEVRKCSGHAQAVRDVVAVGADGGFATVSNDGSLIVWEADGGIRSRWSGGGGGSEAPFLFCAAYRPPVEDTGAAVKDEASSSSSSGEVAASGPPACPALLFIGSDDGTVKVFRAEDVSAGPVQELQVPGTPWSIDALPNGDVVVGCMQAGTSHKGHAYIFSQAESRRACGAISAQYTADCVPPKKSVSQAAGRGEAAAMPQAKGDYSIRNQLPGDKDGAYGFFSMPDGRLMACLWSAEGGNWVDLGVVSGQAGEEDGAAAGGGSGGGAGSGYEFERMVTVDKPEGGTATLQLSFNGDEDPQDITQRFIAKHGLAIDHFEAIRDYVLQERRSEGLPEWGSAGGGGGRSKRAARYRHFPPRGFVEVTPIKFEPLLAAILKQNGSLRESHGDAALTPEEEGTLTALVSVLKEEARYHATKIDEELARIVSRRLLRWPPASAAPATDLLRKMATHVHAAESVLAANADGLVELCERNAAAWASGVAKPALAILTFRLLANLMKPRTTRAAALRALPASLGALSSVASDDRVAASTVPLLQNVAFYCQSEEKEEGGSERWISAARTAAAACQEVLGRTQKEAVVLAVGAAVGTLACCKGLSAEVVGPLEALVRAGGSFGGKVKECADDAKTAAGAS